MRLAACAEMIFLDLPFTERVQRIAEAGFDVEIWNCTRHDVEALAATGPMFSSMTGYVRGHFGDGADELVRTAIESIAAAETLGCPRLNLHGTGLDDKGLPVVPGAEMGYDGRRAAFGGGTAGAAALDDESRDSSGTQGLRGMRKSCAVPRQA